MKKIVLFLITFVFLYFVFINLDIKELCAVIKQFNLLYIIPLSASILISLTFRGLVFKQLLHNTIKAPLGELSHLCITSAALNIILPARAGDIFRAFYIGNKYSVDKMKIFGTVMFERIFDVFVIFTFLLLGIALYHRNSIALKLCMFAGLSMFIGIIIILLAYKFNKTEAVCNFISDKTKNLPYSEIIKKPIEFINKSFGSFFSGFSVLEKPKYLFYAILSSFALWFFECLNFYITILGFGIDIHWSITLFLIGFIALACMVPSASIYIGPYQYAIIQAFVIYDINKETALAVSIVEQAVVIISTSICALIFLFTHNISYKKLKNSLEH